MGLCLTYTATSEIASLHPARTAVISLSDQVLGFHGLVHPVTAKAYDIPETYVAELNVYRYQSCASAMFSICRNYHISGIQP